MVISSLTNIIKLLFSYGYLGFINYIHFKNIKTESWDIKDRLKSYNMKYPITKQFNEIFLNNTRILHYLLLANFILIISAVLFRMKKFGYLSVFLFILNEFYLYNDIIMSNVSNFNAIKGKNVIDIIHGIPSEIACIISLLFGVLFVTSKKYQTN